ncbi:hypothetical protein HanRHA438_Chr05g0218941 [Helianthus annuus]|nr:hypothetical protein HanHA300_Chr05g0171561 [Helianthus annuus]KAJ0584201.1 hypothetical protein HanHA89_Chr05g0185821 [Helianthus annuus]KAJ0749870.1 hypothetical protein HanLR1_Chr05g0175221 [Helianthus annuus]KAJ0918525.1 hypothetical protein HanRHA438_Chr05g0218941 [Helianthus annuus]
MTGEVDRRWPFTRVPRTPTTQPETVMIVEIPTVVHIRWNQLQPQLASRNSLLMILTKISTGLSQSSNSSQTRASI